MPSDKGVCMKRLYALIIIASLLLGLAAFLSCAPTETEVITEGEFTFTVSKRGDTVIGINVESPGRKPSKLNVTGKNLTFTDMNFDGYPDIRLDSLTPSLGTYECFILRPTIGKFVRSSAFSSLVSPEWDTDNKTVRSKLVSTVYYATDVPAAKSEYEETRADLTWKWINGALTLTEEKGITFYSSGNIYCCYSAVNESGVMVRDPATEEWFPSLEALRSAGYVWDDGTEMPDQ